MKSDMGLIMNIILGSLARLSPTSCCCHRRRDLGRLDRSTGCRDHRGLPLMLGTRLVRGRSLTFSGEDAETRLGLPL